MHLSTAADLFLPAVFGVLFHGAWSIVLIWLYATAGLPDDCPELVRASKTGAALLLASFLLTTLLQLWLMVETMQGAGGSQPQGCAITAEGAAAACQAVYACR
jgi:hypothetical protein